VTKDQRRDMTEHLQPARGVLSQEHRLGALSRHLDVVLLEISASGCLIEAPLELPPGTLAMLSVELGGVEYSDPVRIARTQPLQGNGDRFRMGAEFAWLSAPGAQSLRGLGGRMAWGAAEVVSRGNA
jgi:hypothetical protein